MPGGMRSQSSALEFPNSAKAPSRCRLITRSPGLNPVTPEPTATTLPAPSLPGIKGGSGRNWYFPASISTSTYWTPRASMRTCSSPGPGGGGSGTSRSAKTSGPPNASQTIAFIAHSLKLETGTEPCLVSREAASRLCSCGRTDAFFPPPMPGRGQHDRRDRDRRGDCGSAEGEHVLRGGPDPCVLAVVRLVRELADRGAGHPSGPGRHHPGTRRGNERGRQR